MDEYIKWVEAAALENLRFRLQNAENLAREANTTLTVLLAGMGASLAVVVDAMKGPSVTPLAVGAGALVAWLMLCAALLVTRCILSQDLQVPTNEPGNLWHPDWGLDVSRQSGLNNIQARITATCARNAGVASWLDRVRVMAIMSPIAGVLGAAAWWAH